MGKLLPFTPDRKNPTSSVETLTPREVLQLTSRRGTVDGAYARTHALEMRHGAHVAIANTPPSPILQEPVTVVGAPDRIDSTSQIDALYRTMGIDGSPTGVATATEHAPTQPATDGGIDLAATRARIEAIHNGAANVQKAA